MSHSRPKDPSRAGPPPAKPGRDKPRADVDGIPANADAGVQDALKRRTERRDDDPTGATVGSASGGQPEPRLDLGGKDAPGSAAGAPAPDRSAPGSPTRGHGDAAAGAARSATKGGAAGAAGAKPRVDRKATRDTDPSPDAPADESPAESIGRAVSDVVTAPVQDGDEDKTDSPPRRRR